jgi:hypothetical protein
LIESRSLRAAVAPRVAFPPAPSAADPKIGCVDWYLYPTPKQLSLKLAEKEPSALLSGEQIVELLKDGD